MRKAIFTFIAFLGLHFSSTAQQNIIDSNTILLDRLEKRYKSPCLNYDQKKAAKKVIKSDRKTIDELNEIYQTQHQLSYLLSCLNKLGYQKLSKIKQQGELIETVTYGKVTKGRLNGYVEIQYNVVEQKLLSRKIILSTKTGFFCETRELWSNSSIDFIYLRRFIGLIEIPLQITWSNAALESK